MERLFLGAELQTILHKGIDLMVVNESDKVLMDSRHGAAIKLEDQEWIADPYVPKPMMQDCGISRWFYLIR